MSAHRLTLDLPVCVALDFDDAERVVEVAGELAGTIEMVKVGATAFIRGGPALLSRLTGHLIFLDLKLHDIPVQVAGAVRACADLGVDLATVHASGGRRMLEAAAEAAGPHLTLAAVTVLTSLDGSDLGELGVAGSPADSVVRLAEIALSSGIGALVCSPLEVEALRSRFGPVSSGGPFLVVPGVRSATAAPDDQRRTLTPKEAVAAGADLLVVGRPITGADDPVAAARAIAEDL
jgi:orotidine-5'-phosphate decarboxylase